VRHPDIQDFPEEITETPSVFEDSTYAPYRRINRIADQPWDEGIYGDYNPPENPLYA